MVRLDCIVAEDVKDELALRLQRAGVFEVDFLGQEYLDENGLRRSAPGIEAEELSENIVRARKLLDYFSAYDKPDLGFIEDILGVEKITAKEAEAKNADELLSQSKELLEELEAETGELSAKSSAADKKIARLAEEKEKLGVFSQLNFRVEWAGDSKYLAARALAAQEKDAQTLKTELQKGLSGSCGLEEADAADGRKALLVYAPADAKEELDRIIRKTDCERFVFTGEGRVRELLEGVEKGLESALRERSALEEETISLFNLKYARLRELTELLSIEKSRCEVFLRCGATEKTAVMRLWAPKSEKERLQKLIEEATKGLCVIEAEDDPDDAPTLLNNPPVIRSFEMLTKMFSLPNYNEIDPTILIAPTFALFFGLMLTDAVYGIILAATSYLLMKKYGGYSRGLKDLCVIFMVCGASAIAFGFLTGSFLGDLVGKYVLGGVGSQDAALWLDPLYKTNAVVFLEIAAIAGFTHLYIGYFLGLIDALKRGEKKKALTDNASWFILAAGILAIALARLGRIPESFSPLGTLTAVAGLALLLMGSGLMAFLKIVGVIGNTLSYARLLAVALTTAGIAMAFNFLAQISLGVPYVGLLLAALVFIAGHTINILMNTLGAFVHALRLHYVEFFGTFYPGGGREFIPFRQERRYTKSKEGT